MAKMFMFKKDMDLGINKLNDSTGYLFQSRGVASTFASKIGKSEFSVTTNVSTYMYLSVELVSFLQHGNVLVEEFL